ncbi:hypothetical protein DMENIID0001_114180 [Sergentomyia squamirostris]
MKTLKNILEQHIRIVDLVLLNRGLDLRGFYLKRLQKQQELYVNFHILEGSIFLKVFNMIITILIIFMQLQFLEDIDYYVT